LTQRRESIEPGSLVFIDPPGGDKALVMYIDGHKEVGQEEVFDHKKLVYFIDYFLGSRDLCKIMIDGKLAWCQVRFIRSENG